jgi:hypothetical protein
MCKGTIEFLKNTGQEENKQEGQEVLQGICQEMWRRERLASGKKQRTGAMASTMMRQVPGEKEQEGRASVMRKVGASDGRVEDV